MFCLNTSDRHLFSRVKSLSKGNNSKRDPLSSSNLRESTTLPLTSFSPSEPTFVDSIADFPNEKSRFGWSRPTERETSPPFNMDRVPSGRAEGNLSASVQTDFYKVQSVGQSGIIANDCNYTEESYEHEKPSWMNNNKKVDTFQKSALEDRRRTDTLMKQRDVLAVQANNSHSDDELNVLLKASAF
jgi:kinesin family protein 2/24